MPCLVIILSINSGWNWNPRPLLIWYTNRVAKNSLFNKLPRRGFFFGSEHLRAKAVKINLAKQPWLKFMSI